MDRQIQKIVVMGGSFNPPTLAHHLLMKAATDHLGADLGLFVPVSDAYLRRKMLKSAKPMVISPEMRIRMLEAMCAEDSRLEVCTKEIGTVEARTFPTLSSIQKDYPEAEIYFVMGADKLSLLSLLQERWRFLDHFGVVLFSRDGESVNKALEKFKNLEGKSDRIVTVANPEGIEGISSSAIRNRLFAGKDYREMLRPEVYELFSQYTADDCRPMISKFRKNYEFLHNQFNCTFEWECVRYSNAEAAFQSSKYTDIADRKRIALCSAQKAMERGREIIPYDGWEERKTDIMKAIVKAKFEQNPELMQKLLETGNSILYFRSEKDLFWGINVYSFEGENMLGKILMEVRDEYAALSIASPEETESLNEAT